MRRRGVEWVLKFKCSKSRENNVEYRSTKGGVFNPATPALETVAIITNIIYIQVLEHIYATQTGSDIVVFCYIHRSPALPDLRACGLAERETCLLQPN